MNKIVRIYGVGDLQERALVTVLQQAAVELEMEVDVEVYNTLHDFLRAGILAIPALVIGGKIVVNGRVPEVKELKLLLAA